MVLALAEKRLALAYIMKAHHRDNVYFVGVAMTHVSRRRCILW